VEQPHVNEAEVKSPTAPSQQTTNTAISPTSAPKRKAKKKLSRPLWWVREVFAFGLWVYLFVKNLVFDFDVYLINTYFPKYKWLLEVKLLVPLVLLALVSVGVGGRSFYWSLLFVIFYPIVVFFRLLWWITKITFKNWPVALMLVPIAIAMRGKLKRRLAWDAFAILSVAIIFILETPFVLIPAMAYLLVFLYRHYYHAFMPSNVFKQYSASLRANRNKIIAWFEVQWHKSLSKHPEGSEEYDKAMQSELQTLYFAYACPLAGAHALKNALRGHILDFYLVARFVAAFILTILVFALGYSALLKVDPSSFNGVQFGFLEAVGLSLSTVFTTSVSPLQPTSTTAQFLCHIQSISALVLLTIVLSMVLQLMRNQYRNDIEQFISDLEYGSSTIETVVAGLTNLTLAELEREVASLQKGIVTWMRKARGDEELPDTTTSTTADGEANGEPGPSDGKPTESE
jgi:hypothetical protein